MWNWRDWSVTLGEHQDVTFTSKFWPVYHVILTCVCYLYRVYTLVFTRPSFGSLRFDWLNCFAEKKPVFINIGRGSIVSETDLITALENKWLSYSILDVFDTEPLPKESALWTNKKVAHFSNHFFLLNLRFWIFLDIYNAALFRCHSGQTRGRVV